MSTQAKRAGDRVLFKHPDRARGLVPIELVQNGNDTYGGIWETRVLSALDGVALHTIFANERDMIDPETIDPETCPNA